MSTPSTTHETGRTYIWGTGRRKTAVARVRLRAGSGKVLINGRPFEVHFPTEKQRLDVLGPLEAVGGADKWDVWARASGGGLTGQSGAMRLGIARALRIADAAHEEVLRDGGFLTRDSRMVERKKYGQKKARRRFQFSKR